MGRGLSINQEEKRVILFCGAIKKKDNVMIGSTVVLKGEGFSAGTSSPSRRDSVAQKHGQGASLWMGKEELPELRWTDR